MSDNIAEVFNRGDNSRLADYGELGRMLHVLKHYDKKVPDNYYMVFRGRTYLPHEAANSLRSYLP